MSSEAKLPKASTNKPTTNSWLWFVGAYLGGLLIITCTAFIFRLFWRFIFNISE